MGNHWSRPNWPAGRSAYYWYLEFHEQSNLQYMARQCQELINRPDFDLVPATMMHMTLDRLAFFEDIATDMLDPIGDAASAACRHLRPFDISIGPLAGSEQALSFSISPRSDVDRLRETLVELSRSLGFGGEGKSRSQFRPHVGIAYCNQRIAAAPVIASVRRLRAIPPVSVHIDVVSLVALTRRDRAYTWDVVRRMPLG